jgi:hypothetical protein
MRLRIRHLIGEDSSFQIVFERREGAALSFQIVLKGRSCVRYLYVRFRHLHIKRGIRYQESDILLQCTPAYTDCQVINLGHWSSGMIPS